jgi:alkylation response protein AidB-like acyl-CoA dehydrogenase
MDFAFNAEQEELRATARDFLLERAGPEQVRRAMESELGYDPELWKQIASDLGWPAVTVPEAYGGLGLGYVELVALLEEMGGALLCAPFFSSVCLGANALLVCGSDDQKREHLPGIAGGETLATLACPGSSGRWDASGVDATARRDGGDFVLDGLARFVLDGHVADLLIVAARSEAAGGGAGVDLFAVPALERGISRRATPTMDQTRRLADVEFEGVRVPVSQKLGGENGAVCDLRKVLDLAAVALAAEQVGGAQRCLDMAVSYAKERVQFGRPIGSFQAIKHKCADMMVAVESARSASYYAACSAAEDREELPSVASLAKAYCSDAYFRCAADCLQIHGGVGFTWEYDVHLYLKRARSSETFLGGPSYHRERVAREIGL